MIDISRFSSVPIKTAFFPSIFFYAHFPCPLSTQRTLQQKEVSNG